MSAVPQALGLAMGARCSSPGSSLHVVGSFLYLGCSRPDLEQRGALGPSASRSRTDWQLDTSCFFSWSCSCPRGSEAPSLTPHLKGGFTSAFIPLFTLGFPQLNGPGPTILEVLFQKDCFGGFASLISLCGKC